MKRWFVLYTKPNQEIKVVDELVRMGIECYCPTIKVVKQYSDRKKKVLKPLMPSYVLVFIEEVNRNNVFSVSGIVRYLFWLGKPALIRDSEVELMKRYLKGVYESVSLTNFTKGQLYKISEGIFSGKTGKVLETNKNKIKLKLESLGMVVTLKLQAV
jgi:transcriptional antiterminator RfaH